MPTRRVAASPVSKPLASGELFSPRWPRPAVRSGSSQALLAAAVLAVVVAALPAQVQPGLQFAELGKRHLPADAGATQAVAYGDVDGDGDLDMVAGKHDGQNRLYLNNGTGTFTDAAANRMPAGSYPTTALALGDVDGNGYLDIVVGNYGTQNRLYLNNGLGVFTDATTIRMPVDSDDTMSVALGDLDRDGDLDMVVGNYGKQNRLYLNSGNGTFTDATTTRLPGDSDPTRDVALGDVDRDGDLDLVVGNGGAYGQPNRLYLNSGTGTFTDATANGMPVGNSATASLALGDVDGDLDLDLVVADFRQNRLYLNNGAGTFTDATVVRMPMRNDRAFAVALGDVDGDGDLDMVFGNGGGWYGEQNRLYLNNGTGTFADATNGRLPSCLDGTTSVALGDVDGDGDLDMGIGNPDGPDRLYANDGRGLFVDATALRVPVDLGETQAVALGDVDVDGDLDMVVGNGGFLGQQNRLYLNNGMGGFTDAIASRMPVGIYVTTSVALGDLDGDGDLDMVIGNSASCSGWTCVDGQNRLYLNNGTGTFTDATANRMPVDSDSTSSVALGDVDGDGHLDMVIGNYGEQNRLYLNNGTGRFTDATASRMPVGIYVTKSVALGDVDGDGHLDMVIGNYGEQARLYRNDGTGTFTDATASRMPVGIYLTTSVALGDVDGDGALDLVVGNYGQQDRLYRNDGTGTFTDATASRMPVDSDGTTSLALGDVDGDGDPDLVIGNLGWPNGEQNRLCLNDGAGTFTDATTSRLPVDRDRTTSLALGDLDGDGDLDMVFGNVRPRNQVYTNLQRQLDARYLLRAGQPYTLDVYSRYGPPSQLDLAVPYLSTTRLSIPVPPYGILGIDPMAPLPLVQIPQPAGVGTATWTVPNNPAFAGIEIYAQALLLQALTDLRLTNVTADVIVR